MKQLLRSKSQPRSLKTILFGIPLVFAAATSPHLQATTINTGTSSLFPTTAEVIAASPFDSQAGTYATDTALVSLAQTFQTGVGFDLQRIYIRYRTTGSVDLSIFTVTDVGAATHDEPPLPANILFSETIALPDTASTLTAEIVLDSPISILASTGTEGYAIRFSNNSSFQWWRTGATAASVYPGGVAYEDGAYKNLGERDFMLALTTIPEPSVFALLGSGLLAIGGYLRFRRSR